MKGQYWTCVLTKGKEVEIEKKKFYVPGNGDLYNTNP